MEYSEKEMKKDIVTVEKPWGKFTTYVMNRKCTVKILTVESGEIMSLQSHSDRTEMWCMLDDDMHVTVGNVTRPALRGEEFIIPPGTKHRVAAPKSAGRFLEISFGDFDEDDIVRYEDKYGRVR